MNIRAYNSEDESGWVHCRVISFLDCSYRNDVRTVKEIYTKPSISLVAEENGKIIGLLDIELDSDELMYTDFGRGAVLWHMAVLPEYRQQGVASRLWREAERQLIEQNVNYCELWTQEDEAANGFYVAMGFTLQPQNTWLRCHAEWNDGYELINREKTGKIYGVEEIVFQAEISRKEELSAKCTRIDEVRLYSKMILTKQQYLRDPCGSASIPYWKQKSVVIPKNMKIVHENKYDEKNMKDYTDETYFRLYHDLKKITEPILPMGFSVRKASLTEFAAHINSCYDKIGVSETELQGYTKRPVYAESLWLAVQDDKTGEIVATAIGELDSEIGEGILEWVQVSENYRHHGLGCFLVSSLLQKMKDTARFATVSGQCNNPSDPEKLYRKCGFIGNDVWHVLRLR